ncbi:Protein translocase subunit SecF [hydrothermal vent metagenome]|uniref:Protein translocase subunit SecF n=1 Tax=hydrothermal vent metagenome TaxID=652676 RepID=A0A3B0V3N0_9ZZZZ
MHLLGNINIDFMAKRKYALIFSLILITISIGSLVVRGLNFGLDFTGGTAVVVDFEKIIELKEIRKVLKDNNFADAVVQNFGSAKSIQIRLPSKSVEDSSEISNHLAEVLLPLDSGAKIGKGDYIGSQVGDELVEQGSLAILYAMIGILLYVTMRFEWRFSVGSVIALVHDIVITVGVFSVTQVEFDLTILAALLAVIGYSLNDTIVVFDRVRENFKTLRKKTPIQVFNKSINQTLARTIITSTTTLLVLAALFFIGGAMIHGFAFALIIGVIIGTYSSIFVASTATLSLGVSREDLMPVEKEGSKLDHIP